MSAKRWGTRAAIATWALALGTVGLGNGCSSPDGTALAPLALPDRDQFINGGVSLFMENRCGALDCHGQIGRPMRIYSTNGLRKADGPNGGRDTRATTDEERLANYFAVALLEPEDISIARVTEGAYTDFLLLKKPLSIEGGGVRHKGGPVLRSTDAGFECLITWISGKVDSAKCKESLL